MTVHNLARFGSPPRDAAFSPNGDGVEDVTTTSTMLLNDEADVVVRVRDASDDVVRTLFDDHVVNYPSTPWHGTRDDGTQVPDGEYEIEIDATNEVGTAPTGRSVTVDTQPVGTLLAPTRTTSSRAPRRSRSRRAPD